MASSLLSVRDRTQTRLTLSAWMISPLRMNNQPEAETSTYNTQQQTNIYVPDGIRTCSRSKLTAADPCLRLRGRFDQLKYLFINCKAYLWLINHLSVYILAAILPLTPL